MPILYPDAYAQTNNRAIQERGSLQHRILPLVSGPYRGGMVSAQESGQWLSLQQAAEELGVSTEALRMRVRRGKIESRKGEDGKLYVWVVSARSEFEQQTGQGADTALTGELRDQIAHLKGEVDYLREENRRKDYTIAGLVQRVPEIEAAGGHGDSYDARDERHEESPQQDESHDEGYTSTESAPEPQTATPRRSWWRRLFGG